MKYELSLYDTEVYYSCINFAFLGHQENPITNMLRSSNISTIDCISGLPNLTSYYTGYRMGKENNRFTKHSAGN